MNSPDYESAVLKLGVPHPELFTEIHALSYFNGIRMCRCLDADLDLGAMLLEQIIPGTNLTEISDEARCIRIAGDLLSTLPIPYNGPDVFPGYSQWMDRAFSKTRTNSATPPRMIHYMDVAQALFREFEANETQRVLLHGDCHHENILLDQSGNRKAIDPKGVIGFPCLESGRFILNHISRTPIDRKLASLQSILTAFEPAFKRSQRTLAGCAFMDCVLSHTWTLEEHLPKKILAQAQINAVNDCSFFLNALNACEPQPAKPFDGRYTQP